MESGFELLRADLAARRGQLSPRLRQIADYALANPNDMALETIAVIAERAGVPRSSLIRFAQAFDYDGFSAMQRVFRSQLVERTTDYAERLRGLRHQEVANGPASVLSEGWEPRTGRTLLSPIAAARTSPSSRARVDPTSTGPPSISAPAVWSMWAWVTSTPPIPPRASASARTRSTWSRSAGPGSITQAGSDPTT